MDVKLRTDLTVKEICEGFVYNETEGRGLFGWGGKLTIQPEFQRNYLYADGKRDVACIETLLNKYPIGLIYFVKTTEDHYEILDGQQRITSIGRFLTNKFPVKNNMGKPQYFDKMPEDQKEIINNTKLIIYICEGGETEVKNWFKVINMVGIALNEQELSNAVYSGQFVTAAKSYFSNSLNPQVKKWSAYISGSVDRQDFMRTALDWISEGDIDNYMSLHRGKAEDVEAVKRHFTSVIDWVSSVFTMIEKDMTRVEWGRLYRKYHNTPYNSQTVAERVGTLREDSFVTDKKGVYEYILGGEQDPRLLNIRVFNDNIKKTVYSKQTSLAQSKGVSNCPLCALENNNNHDKIWKLNEMDADHVTAWSKGGSTDISNCQMLCKTHNRAKGNK